MKRFINKGLVKLNIHPFPVAAERYSTKPKYEHMVKPNGEEIEALNVNDAVLYLKKVGARTTRIDTYDSYDLVQGIFHSFEITLIFCHSGRNIKKL